MSEAKRCKDWCGKTHCCVRGHGRQVTAASLRKNKGET